MRKVTVYECEICGMDYQDEQDALNCEAEGTPWEYEIGEEVLVIPDFSNLNVITSRVVHCGVKARLRRSGGNLADLKLDFVPPPRYHDLLYDLAHTYTVMADFGDGPEEIPHERAWGHELRKTTEWRSGVFLKVVSGHRVDIQVGDRLVDAERWIGLGPTSDLPIGVPVDMLFHTGQDLHGILKWRVSPTALDNSVAIR